MISCKEYTQIRKEELKKKILSYKRKPVLAVVQVDSDVASNSYISGKKKDYEEVGIECLHIIIDSKKCSQEDLEIAIKDLNSTENCTGIIIQLPIPDKYNVDKLQQCISPEKDVDGFRVDSCFKPCTPKGIMDWLKYNGFNFSGKNATVIGRSKIVGKPLVNMLIDEGATVTCCNSKTKDLHRYTVGADLVISAIGKPKFFDESYFSFGTIVIDVGINRDENGKLCGDVDKERIENNVTYGETLYITPVPGSVGLTTRLALLENTIKAYELK